MQSDELPDFLRAAASYVERHSSVQTGLLHPLHLSPEEKLLKAKKRAKKRRAAKRIND